jgi:hypothetical protein
MSETINIYQMYVRNNCKLGFYITRNSWRSDRYAKVVNIQWVQDGEMIKGEPPYFGGFKNPPNHPRAGKTMGPRLVTIEAEWLAGGRLVIETGGNYSWTQVYPHDKSAANTK